MTIRMATKRQTFALYCITKKDYRNEGLTYNEASDLIKKLGDPNYVKKDKDTKENEAQKIMDAAIEAGMDALNKAKPTPMIVQQHANMMDDNSPVVESWKIEGGVCGFAEIRFKANNTPNRKFLAGLKKAGLVGEHNVWGKSYQGGYTYWVSQGGQSLERKEAFAHAFRKVLENNGIQAYVTSRMD